MKISDEGVRAVGEAAAGGGELPPKAVLHALTSLTGGQVPVACISEVTAAEGRTTWRTVALTATDLVVVQATAQVQHWTYQSEVVHEKVEQVPLTEAYALPREALTRLEVVKTTPAPEQKHPEPHRRQWYTTWQLHFGAETVLLPGKTLSEDLVAALRNGETSPSR